MARPHPLPDNVKLLGETTTRHGNIRKYYCVTCILCGRERNITRHDHAVRLAKHPCKKCSNKSNHPQGEHRGVRLSWLRKFEKACDYRSLDWAIDADYVADLMEQQQGCCSLSGVPIRTSGDFGQITASLDRVNNAKGYIPGNVQMVHKHINMMRGQLSVSDFVAFCRAVASHSDR